MHSVSPLLLRKCLFIAIAGFLIFSPLFVGDKETKYLLMTRWSVYRGMGRGMFDLKYLETVGDGHRPVVLNQVLSGEQLELLKPRRLLASKDLKNLENKICDHYGPKADIKRLGRLATLKGWIVFSDANKNICNDL